MKSIIRLVLGGIFVLGLCAFHTKMAWSGQPVDNTIYAGLLSRHVEDGLVDYAGLKTEESLLDQYLDILAAVPVDQLTPKEQLAFYINAYNAWTWKLILQHYPGITSIKDAGSLFRSPWKKEFVHIDGKTVSLDYIEHDVLRPMFKDPRVHAAVNCASMSCPPLRAEPYEASHIDAQLDDDAHDWINDPQYNRLDGKTLRVSKIFDWFEEDFGGEDGVVMFVRRFADSSLGQSLDALNGDVRLRYLDYDWSLNAVPTHP
ncbi:DUF547 domain-containing protein [Desulfovibrio inopinatus]|uniref:DUF547 domain-containing protein n=1 Tax=Desulfovibrio inopinatus TaxID=102109 RepID=UPI00040844CD|nr:DUF547 domain-containing protein [Desulfovibrio inopinatus]